MERPLPKTRDHFPVIRIVLVAERTLHVIDVVAQRPTTQNTRLLNLSHNESNGNLDNASRHKKEPDSIPEILGEGEKIQQGFYFF